MSNNLREIILFMRPSVFAASFTEFKLLHPHLFLQFALVGLLALPALPTFAQEERAVEKAAVQKARQGAAAS
jgi:hypothetical protein